MKRACGKKKKKKPEMKMSKKRYMERTFRFTDTCLGYFYFGSTLRGKAA